MGYKNSHSEDLTETILLLILHVLCFLMQALGISHLRLGQLAFSGLGINVENYSPHKIAKLKTYEIDVPRG